MFLGGLTVVAAIAGWIVLSGNGPHYLEAVRNPWLRSYYGNSERSFDNLRWLAWECRNRSILQFAGAALGLFEIARAFRAGPGERARRGILGAACVGWLLQGNFLQGRCGYHVHPGLLLCLGTLWGLLPPRPRAEQVLATVLVALGLMLAPWLPTWALVGVGAATFGAIISNRRCETVQFVAVVASIAASQHALLAPARLARWPQCWTGAQPAELADALTIRTEIPGAYVGNADLQEVAEFLRQQGVRDRDVECFSNAALPLYPQLGLRPPHRQLMPTVTNRLVPQFAPIMAAEIRAAPKRFVVSARNSPLDDFYREDHGYPEGPVVFRNERYEVRKASPRPQPQP